MKRLLLRTTLAAVSLAALGACATRDASQAWRIEPLLRVQHSAEASAAFYRTGRYYDGMRRWAQAADEYRKATIADPRNADAFNAMGVALARLGDLVGAENRLRQALALNADRADVRSNLGLLLMQAGRPAEAVAEMRAAVALDKDSPVAQDNLRQALAHGTAVMAAIASQEDQEDAGPPTQQPVPAEPVAASSVAAPVAARESAMQVIDQPSVAWRASALPDAAASRSDTSAAEAKLQTLQLEISNGNGIPGAAARLRRWLSDHGLPTQRLSNRKPYLQHATVIEYRDGHEGQANQLARLLPTPVTTQPGSGLRTDVRVLLGHDWQRMAACLEGGACVAASVRMADAGTAR